MPTKLAKLDRSALVSNFIVLAVILGIYFIFYWKTGLLTSGFRYFIDDHQIPTIKHDLGQQGYISTVVNWIKTDLSINRFRPFYYIQLVTQSATFGLRPTLWFSYLCLSASLTTFFLFLFARLRGISIVLSLLFAALSLWGSQAEIWARPSIPEAPGALFLSLSLVLAVLSVHPAYKSKILDALFFISVLLSSLSKEVFILCIPALIGIRVWLFCQSHQVSLKEAIRQNTAISGILLGLAALEILYIKLFLGTSATGYAGFDRSNLDLKNLLATVATLAKESHYQVLLAAIVLLAITVALKRQSFNIIIQELLPGLLIFLLIVVPQILIYAKSGISGYYLVPGVIGFALITVEVISCLQLQIKFVGYFVTAIAIVLLWSAPRLVWNTYSRMAQDSVAMNQFFNQIVSCSPQDKPILIVVNPRVRFEASVSLKRILNYRYDEDQLILATYGLEKTDFFSETMKDTEKTWSFIDPGILPSIYNNETIRNYKNRSQIDTIVVFDHLDNDLIQTSQDWFNPQQFQQRDFQISFAPARVYCKNK